MGGGLLQLVAYGAQDVYLTGNPQITFFKVVYRRHTNFSLESIQQTFNGNATLGQRVTCQISRNGDLVHKLYLQATVAKTPSTVYKNIGHWLVKQVEVEIGGQMIDRQYGEWMYIWNELTLPKGKEAGFGEMIKTFPDTTDTGTSANVYVPLEFWFCRNIGLALPLIALQYHEVKINLTLNDADASNGITGVSNVELWADYIFLDTDERRRFAQLSHEYLIEQVQFTGGESIDASSSGTATVTTKSKLSFNHPVKELVWVNKPTTATTSALWNGYQSTTDFQLQLNGNDRFAKRDAKYFTHVQPYQHHENIPDGKHIHVYSFALKPEEHQPSGTLNMSRIDTATAIVGTAAGSAAGTLNMYAVNYNVLRILSGMGGLAYSN